MEPVKLAANLNDVQLVRNSAGFKQVQFSKQICKVFALNEYALAPRLLNQKLN